MQATEFEVRHQTLLRHLLVGAALATYLADPDDVVWRFIKSSPERRPLEHLIFLLAALFVGAGAWLCTRYGAFSGDQRSFATEPGAQFRFQRSKHAGELLYAIGLATLFPLAGAVVLAAGESFRALRLSFRELVEPKSTEPSTAPWPIAIRRESAKWGLALTMLVFSITLIDRVAEGLAAASVIAWALLNLPSYRRR